MGVQINKRNQWLITRIMILVFAAPTLFARVPDFVGDVSKDWSIALSSDDPSVDAFEFERIRINARANFELGYGVVQVSAEKSAGSGSVVLLDQEPVILTNSHVLAGRNSANVTFPKLHFSARAHAILDVPAADIALLRLEIPKNGKQSQGWIRAETAAWMNGRFCSPHERKCRDGYQSHLEPIRNWNSEVLCAVIGGSTKCTRTNFPWLTVRAKDQVISGIYPSLLQIPLFARPGMSGGAFYSELAFAGILAKVDLGLGSYAYAIPVKSIAKVIAQKYFGVENDLKIPPANWSGGSNNPTLTLQLDHETLTSSPRSGKTVAATGGEAGNSGGGEAGNSGGGEAGNSGGGEAGNSGGGEAGNSGEDAAFARYWTLRASIFHSSQIVMTANPFYARSHDLKVNEHSVSALKIKSNSAPGGIAYFAPTLAAYTWFRTQNAGFRSVKWEPLYSSPQAAMEIFSRRQSRLAYPKYARMYVRDDQGVYAQDSSGGFDTQIADGTQALFPDAVLGNRPKDSMGKLLFDINAQIKEKADDPNYFGGYPYQSAKEMKGKFLDVKARYRGANYSFRMNSDLGEIQITDSAASKPIVLKRANAMDAPTLIYCQASGCEKSPYRASVSWQMSDLGKLDRILITTPGKIHEFVGCVPDPKGDCVR